MVALEWEVYQGVMDTAIGFCYIKQALPTLPLSPSVPLSCVSVIG